jgi:membrane-bound metal-dependent hydrolase YbcI (DUF457 family)
MDPLTHGLASFAATRAIFPRAPREAVIAAVIAGTAADIDGLSAFAGAGAYFAASRTYVHSLLAAVVIAVIAAALSPYFWKKKGSEGSPFALVWAMATLAALLHAAMDLIQSDGVALLWPFRGTRFALDWMAGFDLWILAALLAGVLVPGLLRLVTEEIGARSKSPRGRVGAIIALSALAVYAGGRAVMHSNAVAALDARTYRGESPRRAAAFAESFSVLEWRGIVETDRALYQVAVPSGPGATFDPEAAVATFKPEASAALDAARSSPTARRFLATARFPKATIEKTTEGFRCEFRDLRFAAAREMERAVAALVALGADAQVRESEIVWEKDLPR